VTNGITTEISTDVGAPTADDLRRRAADQGFVFELSRYAAALQAHTALRESLLRLRAVPLSFLEPIEPDSALIWLESGRVSPSSRTESGELR
jgi:hypothetical protein